MTTNDKFVAALRTKQYSLTPTRLGVFSYLERHGPVATTRLIQDNAGLADRASLYRTLTLFRELNIIEDIVMSGRRLIELTDHFDRHHHHLNCSNCGRTITMNHPGIEQLVETVAAAHNFQAKSHHIEIDGLCASCTK